MVKYIYEVWVVVASENVQCDWYEIDIVPVHKE